MAVNLSDLSESGRDAIAAIFASEGYVNGRVTAEFVTAPIPTHNIPPAATVTGIPRAAAQQHPTAPPVPQRTNPAHAAQPTSRPTPSRPLRAHPPGGSSNNATRVRPTRSIAVVVRSQVEAYKKCTANWSSFFHEMASRNMSGGERADFETVRGMVRSIERLLESDAGLNIPQDIRLAIQQDLIVRRAVSAVYLSRSDGAHPNSPLVQGNERHAHFQQAIVQIGNLITRYSLPVGAYAGTMSQCQSEVMGIDLRVRHGQIDRDSTSLGSWLQPVLGVTDT